MNNNLTLKQQEIINWLHTDFIGKYTVDFTDNDEIIINGDISLINYKLEELLYKFNEINGDFSIGGHKFYDINKANKHSIKSLKNCPESVTGNFSCALCPNLKSLQYGPIKIGKNYYCNNTGIISFDYIADEIFGNIIAYCNYDLINIEAIKNIKFKVIDIDLCQDCIYCSDLFKELKESLKISNNSLYYRQINEKELNRKYKEANKLA